MAGQARQEGLEEGAAHIGRKQSDGGCYQKYNFLPSIQPKTPGHRIMSCTRTVHLSSSNDLSREVGPGLLWDRERHPSSWLS